MSDNLPATHTDQPTSIVVSDRARSLIQQRYAEGTATAYANDRAAWEAEGITLPADPQRVVEVLTAWHDTGLSPSTLTRRTASLSTLHSLAGYPSPAKAEAVRSVLIGIRRESARGEKRGRGQARAITPAELRRAVGEPVAQAFPVQEVRGKFQADKAGQAEALRRARDRAMLLVGFCAALRRSEIVALDAGDISQDGHRGLLVTIRRSKTDQEGEGATIAIPFGGLGTDTAEALEAWRTMSGITSGPLFVGVNRHGGLGNRITAESANRIVQARAAEGGVDPAGLSAHSLRAGYVTAQAARNVPEYRIQTVTRHKSAEVLRAYIRAATVMERTPDLVLD